MSNFSKSMSYRMLSGTGSISDMIKKTNKEYVTVEVEKISGQMLDMENTPLNRLALKMIQQGVPGHEIRMMASESDKIVTNALPFATYKSGGKIVTNAYLENIGRIVGDRFVCTAQVAFALFGSAAIANSCFDGYENLTNKDIMIPLMEVYSDMVLGIFNVLVHARSDKKLSDVIVYGSRRFFLENMLNIQDENVASIAIKGLNNIDQSIYEKAKLLYEKVGVPDGDLETWITWIQKVSPKTRTVDKRIWIEKWIRQYGEYSYFGMDNVEYLIWSILATLAYIQGSSRQLQVILKGAKHITKLHSSLYTYAMT